MTDADAAWFIPENNAAVKFKTMTTAVKTNVHLE